MARALLPSLLLLLSLLLSVSLSLQVDLSLPSASRWRSATREYLDARGAETVASEIRAVLHKSLPEPILGGISPLVKGFLEAYEDSKVEELRGIVEELNLRLPGKKRVELAELVKFNVLVDLAAVFPSVEKGGIFSLPKTTQVAVSFLEGSQLIEQKNVIFGFVGETPGKLLSKVDASSSDASPMSYFLAHTVAALETMQGQEAEILPTRNDSRCTQTDSKIECTRSEGTITADLLQRSVLWEVPLGTPPASGWPVVIMYQGSFFAPHVFSWNGASWMPFGAYEQTKVIKTLLDNGYAVITPESKFNGYTFWDTNIPPVSYFWDFATDHQFVKKIIQEIADPEGLFGHLNPKMKFATGISSGGYMTSRMAVSYEGEFRSLVVASGSYATCAGPICVVPGLPRSHPPTLHLHGGNDLIVPKFTMEMYYDELIDMGIPSEKIIEDKAGHEWITGSAEAVLDWFRRYP